MRYLLFICIDPDAPTDADPSVDDGTMDVEQWVSTMDGNGSRILGERIRPEADATTVRVRGGELLVSDGPFVETKELIAGFDVIQAPDLDAAIEIARLHPMAGGGVVEIRPFWVD